MENQTTDKAPVKMKGGYRLLHFLTHSQSGASVIGKSILLLLIPYGYLFLCGLIFDYALHMPNMVYFIFFSMIALYVIAILLIVVNIRNFRGRRRRRSNKETKTKS